MLLTCMLLTCMLLVQLFLTCMLLHAADISNPAKKRSCYLQVNGRSGWVELAILPLQVRGLNGRVADVDPCSVAVD